MFVRFLVETVYDLRKRLNALGSNLLIRFGRPEVILANMIKGFQAQGDLVSGVYLQSEVTPWLDHKMRG